MKKRKSPILLVTVLVLCGGAVAFINLAGTRSQNPQQPSPDAQSEARTTQSPAELAKANAGRTPSVARDAMAKAPPGMPGAPDSTKGPVIVMPKSSAVAPPAPNDSQVRGRWYEENSYDAKKPNPK